MNFTDFLWGFACLALIFGVPVRSVVDWWHERKKYVAYKTQKENELLLYTGHTKNEIASLCGMPDDVCIGSDDAPYWKGPNPKPWAFYVDRRERCYHQTKNCAGMSTVFGSTVLLKVDEWSCWGGLSPCPICNPPIFSVDCDVAWYDKFIHVWDEISNLKERENHYAEDTKRTVSYVIYYLGAKLAAILVAVVLYYVGTMDNLRFGILVMLLMIFPFSIVTGSPFRFVAIVIGSVGIILLIVQILRIFIPA